MYIYIYIYIYKTNRLILKTYKTFELILELIPDFPFHL